MDFNTSKVRLKAAVTGWYVLGELEGFQYLKGAIKGARVWRDRRLGSRFQYLKGAIKGFPPICTVYFEYPISIPQRCD